MKKIMGFLRRVVVLTLLYVVASVVVFTILQLHYGIDPTPHYDFLRVAVPTELLITGALEAVNKVLDWRRENNNESEGENG